MTQPTEEQTQAHPNKERLDVVIALGPEGKEYHIPTNVAEQYVSEPNHDPFPPPDGDEEVAGGRNSVLRANGTFGPHTDWIFGPYVWHVDGCVYQGLHRHPNPFSQLAVDTDG